MKNLLLPLLVLGGAAGVAAYYSGQKKPASGGGANVAVTLPTGVAPAFNPNAVAFKLPPDFSFQPVSTSGGVENPWAREMRRRAFVEASRRALRGG